MVDQKSATYRPRRAFIEPDSEPAKPIQPAGPDNANGKPIPPPVVDEDHPKPLYRDETRANGWYSPAARAAAAPESDPPTDESVPPITFAPRRTRGLDEEETTAILPRSRQGQHRSQTPLDAIHDYDEDERRPLGRRTKLALLIGGVAVVVVIGLLVGYAVLSAASQRQRQPGAGGSPGASGTSGGTSDNASQPPDQTGTASLSDASMLNPVQAENLDSKRTWKVELTQRNPAEDAPTAACFGGEPLDGQPTPQQKILRVLTSSGKNHPTALHEAMAYNSTEEASQAFAIASRTLGGCAVTGSYIESGRVVSGVGNQAVGVVVKVVEGTKSQAHSIVLNHTGRVMNVVDAVQPSQALAITAVATALQQVNNVQCGPAGGECGGTLSVKDGPPPLGGDEAGYLATGDLPPAGPKVASWVATKRELKEKFDGSQCENVNWKTVPAESKDARTYLIQDTGTNFFGLDEIVLTTKDAKAASKQVDKIKSKLASCKDRQPTATVSKPAKVTGIGAENTKVAGWTAVVSQKSTDGTHKYRVGIVSAGPKVIYTFLNPKEDYDFSRGQWDMVAVRAGQRATQINN